MVCLGGSRRGSGGTIVLSVSLAFMGAMGEGIGGGDDGNQCDGNRWSINTMIFFAQASHAKNMHDGLFLTLKPHENVLSPQFQGAEND